MDVVFANAGITEKGSLLPEKDGKLTKPELTTIDVNFVGVLYSMSAQCLPLLLAYLDCGRANSDERRMKWLTASFV